MIPFSPPRIDDKTIAAVVDALRSGWITTGPRTKEFEKKLAEYNDVPNVLAVNSATAGMELILRWFGVGPGDEVIIPAYTYCATANVVMHCGAKPVMVDAGDDFNINAELIEKAITSKTKVIIPVDLGGWPCDYEHISTIINKDGIRQLFIGNNERQQELGRILLMADAAHSLGAVMNGVKAAKLSDIAVFSTHAVKNLTTAEGGAICLNLPEPFDNHKIYKYLNIFSLHGQNKDALAKSQRGNWEYDVIEAGYKCNMPDVLAAIGLVELERYEKTLERRAEIFDFYSGFFSKFDWAELPPYKSSVKKSSYHLYLLRVRDIHENQRNQIIQKIFERDVSVNVHFKPLPLMTFYKEQGYEMSQYPQAFDNYAREISLPVYYDLKDEELSEICHAVSDSVHEILEIKN